MARPLREQFALATLLLVLPVSGVILWAANGAYQDQVVMLAGEAGHLASAVAAYVAETRPGTPELESYLNHLQWPAGTVVSVNDATGRVLAKRADSAPSGEELSPANVTVPGLGWQIHVGIPTAVAWGRTMAIYRRIVAISAVSTFLLILVDAIFLRRWLRSLAYFQRSADRVGAGDLRAMTSEPMPSREFERVRDAFAGMVENLREAREAEARQMEHERRMREEMQSLQQQIVRQERLAAIGTLLSGITHELNNPLQAITGLAEVLQRDRGIREDVRADLLLIQKESRRASNIIRNLSRFGRQAGTTPTEVLVSDVILSVVELRQRRLRELDIELSVEERAEQSAHAVFAELQQVLLNFVINAEQAVQAASPAERRIVIRTIDRPGRVRIEVEDTGPGVAVDDEPKLFQPFFTTKPIGEGTGLGLSVSYNIMQSCGGTIGYEPRPGGGARFFFEVPAEPDVAVPAPRQRVAHVPAVRH